MRTTVTTVKSIIDTALDDSNVSTYIGMANRLVTNQLSSTTLTSDQLTDIETWLTAHLIAMSKERTALNEKIGDVWVTYTGEFGEGLKATPYGQMVLALDESGEMSKIGKQSATLRSIYQVDQ